MGLWNWEHRQRRLKNKTILLRADLNVPFKEGKILDETRIQRFMPTLESILTLPARVVLLTHLGRPQGTYKPALSLKPIVEALKNHLPGHAFSLVALEDAEEKLKTLDSGQCLVLENIRFYPGEESNEGEFSKKLASLGDIFINDAFSVSHRAHASVEGVAHHLPSYAGPQVEAELKALNQALTTPRHPVMAMVAGAKVSTKLGLLKSLAKTADVLVIAGGLAHTFLKAQGFFPGKDSLAEETMIPLAEDILKTAHAQIILPLDVVASPHIESGTMTHVFPVSDIPHDCIIGDMGPKTLKHVCDTLEEAQTLIWNGVVGIFEVPPFHEGTVTLAKHVGRLTEKGTLFSLVGGGETLAGLNKAGVLEKISYASTAGGAFLEYVQGLSLPGIEILRSKEKEATVGN